MFPHDQGSGGAPPDPIDERVPLEALPASTSLIVLHSCPFVRFVTANNATCRCAKDAMVTGKMARSTAKGCLKGAVVGATSCVENLLFAYCTGALQHEHMKET